MANCAELSRTNLAIFALLAPSPAAGEGRPAKGAQDSLANLTIFGASLHTAFRGRFETGR
jgi:hypothetical protein